MGRRRKVTPVPPSLVPLPPDPSEVADGTERVLLFRAPERDDDVEDPTKKKRRRRETHRASSGLVGIFYDGSIVQSMRAMQQHALVTNGPGRYRIVVQRMSAGCWAYLTSTVIAVGVEVPPEPGSEDDECGGDRVASSERRGPAN